MITFVKISYQPETDHPYSRLLHLATQMINNKKNALQKREELKREAEGDQKGRAGTIFFASGHPTKVVFKQNSA
jgi:hypothetical protein